MEKIAILTTLCNFNPSYAVATVIIRQARLLKKFGKSVKILVLENCKDDYPDDLSGDIEKIVPVFTFVSKRVTQEVIPAIQNMLQTCINKGITTFFCHDIILVDTYITYNEALRRIAGANPGVHWYHWMHSGPHLPPAEEMNRYEKLTHTLPANSKLVYLNYVDLQKAIEMYTNCTIDDTHVVYTPLEYIDLCAPYDPVSIDISNKIHFNDATVRCIYPFSSTRIGAKQILRSLELLSTIKARGEKVAFIGCNCHCNGQTEKNNIDNLVKAMEASPYNLTRDEIFFTSWFEPPQYEYSLPNKIIMDLFRLSNLFIFPSLTEVGPLILQEAAMTENLIVANADVPAMMEMVGPNGALYYHFGSTTHQAYGGRYNNIRTRLEYYSACADSIIRELNKGKYQTNAMCNCAHKYNQDTIWLTQYKQILGPCI